MAIKQAIYLIKHSKPHNIREHLAMGVCKMLDMGVDDAHAINEIGRAAEEKGLSIEEINAGIQKGRDDYKVWQRNQGFTPPFETD